jgi:hypothetical protein
VKIRYLFLIAGLVACIPFSSVFGQSVPELGNEDDVLGFCETVMGHLASEDYQSAFDMLTAVSVPQMSGDLYNLQMNTAEQINGVQATFGSILGYKLVKVQNMKNVLLEVLYIEQFENHALRWQFVFYKPRDQWLLDNIQWDDQVSLLFEWRSNY